VQYDWYLGGSPVTYETPTVIPAPQSLVKITRVVTFPKPGVYEVTLRATAQRNGVSEFWTNMQNLARVQVLVQ
jgi:hypothetical protein